MTLFLNNIFFCEKVDTKESLFFNNNLLNYQKNWIFNEKKNNLRSAKLTLPTFFKAKWTDEEKIEKITLCNRYPILSLFFYFNIIFVNWSHKCTSLLHPLSKSIPLFM